MSEVFTYICTRTTADPYVPSQHADTRLLSRDVSDAFSALAGGHFVVGTLRFYPVQRTVPNHLLCDGREIPKAAFPELADYLGTSQGTPIDPDNFVLPDYTAALTPAPTPNPETVENGTVTTGGGTDYTGDADSGGRLSRYALL